MALDLQSEQDRLNKSYELKLNEVKNKYNSEDPTQRMGVQENLNEKPLFKDKYEKQINTIPFRKRLHWGCLSLKQFS